MNSKRYLFVLLVVFVFAACSTKPPAVKQTPAGDTEVVIADLGVKLTVPARWKVTGKEQVNERRKETKVTLRDTKGNAHFTVYLLEQSGWYDVYSWASSTLDNAMKRYSGGYAWSVIGEEREDIDVGNDREVGSIRRTVSIPGNIREMAVAYADRPAADSGEQWIIILGYNKGRRTNIDAELNELTTALVNSFWKTASR